MTKILTISNHKGGVGKTTSTMNIGAGLNRLKQKVLLIDLDPQANLTQCLGASGEENNIYFNLKGTKKAEPLNISKGLDLIPSHIDLSGAEIELTAEIGREYKLKKLIEPLKKDYDVIIIDSPPSLGLLTINSLSAADYVLLPLQAEYLALQGLTKLLEVIDLVKETTNPALQIGGVFITRFDKRKVLNKNVSEIIEKEFKDIAFKTIIRDNIALAESPVNGMDIFRYSPKSNGAEDYLKLSKEVKKLIKG